MHWCIDRVRDFARCCGGDAGRQAGVQSRAIGARYVEVVAVEPMPTLLVKPEMRALRDAPCSFGWLGGLECCHIFFPCHLTPQILGPPSALVSIPSHLGKAKFHPRADVCVDSSDFDISNL